MGHGLGFATETFESNEHLLRKLLDRLELGEIGGYESAIHEGRRLEELLDQLEVQETGGNLSGTSLITTRSCPPRSSGSTPTDVLDRFDFDKATLKSFHSDIVQRLARQVAMSWTTQQPIHAIRVIGYTDFVGQTRTDAYNRALGLRRARAVQSALYTAIELQRRTHWRARILKGNTEVVITPSTEGARDPVGNNRTPEGRACNRRVEVFLEASLWQPAPAKSTTLPGTITVQPCPLKDYPNCPPGATTTPVPEPPRGPIRGGQTLPPLPPPPAPSPSAGQRIRDWANRTLSILPEPVRNAIVNNGSQAALGQALSAMGITGQYQDALLAVWRALRQ